MDGQVVLKKSYNYAEIGDAVHNKITEFAGRGFRALGVTTAPDDGTDGEFPLLFAQYAERKQHKRLPNVDVVRSHPYLLIQTLPCPEE